MHVLINMLSACEYAGSLMNYYAALAPLYCLDGGWTIVYILIRLTYVPSIMFRLEELF